MSGESKTVIVEQKFATDGGNVYDAFLDPSIARKFLFATPTGKMVRAEIDGVVGGAYIFVERRGDEDVLHTGEYLELIRPSRMVFTFRVPKYSSETSTVQIDIAPAGEGCDLTLTNTGVLAEWAERTREGWERILRAAEKVLTEA
jgi:uncharacterized protein YndB with AHSA1/START domain